MHIYPLGTSGFFPSHGRETISCLVISNNTAILFDAGTGVRRLLERDIQIDLQNVDSLNVVLSHLHHDHIAGLTWLAKIWQKQLNIYLPGSRFLDCDTEKSILQITQNPFFAKPLSEWPQFGKITTFNEESFEVNGIMVKAISQKHCGGSVGYRVGNFGVITDTVPSAAHIKFLSDCELVLFDTMHDEKDFMQFNLNRNYSEHGCPAVISNIAKKANIRKVGIIHIDPGYDEPRITRLLDSFRHLFENVFIPIEGVRIEL